MSLNRIENQFIQISINIFYSFQYILNFLLKLVNFSSRVLGLN